MSDDTSSASGSSLHGLRGLQIDATARQPRKRSRLWTLLLSLVLILGIGGLGLGLYRMTLGKPLVVQVAFARLTSTDNPATGPILSGAGLSVWSAGGFMTLLHNVSLVSPLS